LQGWAKNIPVILLKTVRIGKHESTVPLRKQFKTRYNLYDTGSVTVYPLEPYRFLSRLSGISIDILHVANVFYAKGYCCIIKRLRYGTCNTMPASGVTVPIRRVIADRTECCFKTGIKSKRYRYLLRARLPVHTRKIRP
jgi:hypothetical protein